MYYKKYGLSPGDSLIEPIFKTGLTKHYSVYLGFDQNYTEWIAENHWKDGVRLVTAEDYFATRKLVRIHQFTGSQPEREAAVRRALELLGQPYDLINYNCEHYVSYVQTGKAESRQVLNVLAILLLTLLLAFAMTPKKSLTR